MTWIFNTVAMTATHVSSLRIQFDLTKNGADKLHGTVIGVVPYSITRLGQDELMRLITEAGVGMAHALSIKNPSVRE